MKVEVIIYNVVNLLVIIFNVIFYIKAVKLRKKNKEILDGLRAESDEAAVRLNTLINDINEGIRIHNERVDLLSRENSKLIEKNEELKDMLRNLGVKI